MTFSFALIGKSGAGKSTVAQLMQRHFNTQHVSTGAICREISRLLYGNDNKGTTQKIDDALTTISPSIFLEAALRGIDSETLICVDSLRFENDYKIAISRGFKTIRVCAPDLLRNERLHKRNQSYTPGIHGNHSSETALDTVSVDHTIINDGDWETIDEKVRSICMKYQ